MRNKKQYSLKIFVGTHEVLFKWVHGIFTIEGLDMVEDVYLKTVFKDASDFAQKCRNLELYDENGHGVDMMGLPIIPLYQMRHLYEGIVVDEHKHYKLSRGE
jgi:hypothetical protein